MLFDLLSRFRSGGSDRAQPRTQAASDEGHWADAIGLELKGLIAQAVVAELESREKKYLQSILAKSQFMLESLVVIPLDQEASTNFESFLTVHSEVDPAFKTQFFRSLMESQYRSARGSLVVVSPDFQPTVQFLSQSLEQPSEDELYRVSLRGRRLNFEVRVALKGPVAKANAPASNNAAAGLGTLQGGASAVDGPSNFSSSPASGAERAAVGESLLLRIWDGLGERMVEVSTPCLIGREAPNAKDLGGMSFVSLQGQYVSRRHLVIVNVLEDTYFFVHDAASLSCLSSGGQLLRPSTVYSMPRHSEMKLLFGATTENRQQAFDTSAADQFPIVEIRRKGASGPSITEATPRPRAIK
ncbi:MAG: FHA domain-containing protein [Betaproteobacteria bacterium]|nr:FHA domain-containing protein [Betaproteobacteria bacterium]